MTDTNPDQQGKAVETAEPKQQRALTGTSIDAEHAELDFIARQAKLARMSGLFGDAKEPELAARIMFGRGMGLNGMQACQAIIIVKNKPSLTAAAQLALAQSNPDFAGIDIQMTGEGDTLACTGTLHRKTHTAPYTASFSVAQAKQAGIYQPTGAWGKYTEDMLRARVISRVCRMGFADMTLGMLSDVEIKDGVQAGRGTEESVQEVAEVLNAEPTDAPLPPPPPLESTEAEVIDTDATPALTEAQAEELRLKALKEQDDLAEQEADRLQREVDGDLLPDRRELTDDEIDARYADMGKD